MPRCLTYGGTMTLQIGPLVQKGTFNVFSFTSATGSFASIIAVGAYNGPFGIGCAVAGLAMRRYRRRRSLAGNAGDACGETGQFVGERAAG